MYKTPISTQLNSSSSLLLIWKDRNIYLENGSRDGIEAEDFCLRAVSSVVDDSMCAEVFRLPWAASVTSQGVSVGKEHVMCCVILSSRDGGGGQMAISA